MIYGIKVKDFIIREISRQINREQNQLFFTLLFDVAYGSQWSGENAELRKSYGFSVSKELNPVLWASLKDMNNKELIEHTYRAITEYFADYSRFKSFEENPEYETVVQGEAQEPVEIMKANPADDIEERLAATLFSTDTSLLDLFREIKTDPETCEVVELG
ncbi:hypothetical protein [Breznakiella homolactica]|uniref:Uncharacterized protein n=1 Tax=Breznakiella homolactica TaxID=2798577 RepID=A0A7T8BBE2_9SPIR|nr:hypothetical protein [Breznakiella homolactica]QQO10311.1 hypothetical protein JFL75_05165 [Breznakiella homolactica]